MAVRTDTTGGRRGQTAVVTAIAAVGVAADNWRLAALLAFDTRAMPDHSSCASGPGPLVAPWTTTDNAPHVNAPIDLGPLRRALAMLREALDFWQTQAYGTRLKPHLRFAVIQSFEFSYELSVRLLRRVLIERAASAPAVADLSFNDLLRRAADAGVVADPLRWREWRELRNSTSHAYDEATAQAVAGSAPAFLTEAEAQLLKLERGLGD